MPSAPSAFRSCGRCRSCRSPSQCRRPSSCSWTTDCRCARAPCRASSLPEDRAGIGGRGTGPSSRRAQDRPVQCNPDVASRNDDCDSACLASAFASAGKSRRDCSAPRQPNSVSHITLFVKLYSEKPVNAVAAGFGRCPWHRRNMRTGIPVALTAAPLRLDCGLFRGGPRNGLNSANPARPGPR